jgi:hypothetical protein
MSPFFTGFFTYSLFHSFTFSLLHFFTSSLFHCFGETMNYPFWDIPILGSGWVIGIIAIFHVMISQFAVGGGLYLPMAERKALRMPEGQLRTDWLNQLASHSKFFPHPHRRLRHRQRRGHLVRHRPHSTRGHQHADS